MFHASAKILNYFVQRVDDRRTDEEYPKARRARQTGQAVDQAQRVQGHVEAVRRPKEFVGLLPYGGMCEDEDDCHHDEEKKPGQTCSEGKKTEELAFVRGCVQQAQLSSVHFSWEKDIIGRPIMGLQTHHG